MNLCNVLDEWCPTRRSVFALASRLFVAWALAQSTGVALAEDCIVPAAGIAGNVTLRTAPSASSPANGALRDGQSLPLVALMRGWYETRLATGQPSFAAKRSTDIAPCPAGIAPVVGAGGGLGASGGYEVHAIDVGTGLSVLVSGPEFSLLSDAGSNDDMARGEANRTIAYLKSLLPDLQKR